MNGAVLGGDDMATLRSLTTGENMVKVSQQLVVGAKLRALRDVGYIYVCLSKTHMCSAKTQKVSMYQYIPRMYVI